MPDLKSERSAGNTVRLRDLDRRLRWEIVESNCQSWRPGESAVEFKVWRAKVPGGWFVASEVFIGSFFYADPKHEWDGGSLP